MRVDILEFWAAMILIVAYIVAAMFRRGAGSDGLYRKGLLHLSIAFFMMEVVPPILALINSGRDHPKNESGFLLFLGIIAMIAAVILYLNSLRLLCNWLLGERGTPGPG